MKRLPTLALLLLILISGCNRGPLVYRDKVAGYEIVIKALPGSVSAAEANSLMRRAVKMFAGRIKPFSKEDNPLLRLSSGTPQTLTPELMELVRASQSFTAATDSLWNPFLLGLLRSSKSSGSPPADLETAVQSARAAIFRFESDNRVSVDGGHYPDLKMLALGSAVDDAVKVLSDGGVMAGMFTAGGVTCYWGELPTEPIWSIPLSSQPNDTIRYNLNHPSDSFALLDIGEYAPAQRLAIWQTAVNQSAEADTTPIAQIAVWAPRAASAAVLAETALTIGHREALQRFAGRDTIGVLFRYLNADDAAVETNPAMAPYVSVDIP
jgi:hypothetical protein